MTNLNIDTIKKCWWVKMHATVTVWTKWQVVIPSEVRELLNINPWDNLMVITKHGKALWMIKTDDMDELMEFMQREINEWKNIKNN